jgi:hypothetical protein
MDFEFDKEIDALLRKARADETAVSSAPHLAADELSAFAENALPDNARQNYTAHLAECARCRKVLSNLIALNSEAETVSAFSTFPAGISAAPQPWYRRLFAFPQIAYAMGALVLIFSGFAAYIVLQNATGSQSSTVAQREEIGERPLGAGGVNSDGATAPTFAANTTSNMTNATVLSNAATANANATTARNTASSNAATYSANSTANAAAPPTASATPPAEPLELARTEPKKNLVESENKTVSEAPSAAGTTQPKDDKNAAQADETAKEKSERDRTEVQDAAKMRAQRTQPAPSSPKKVARPESGETRRIGNKIFRRLDSAWVDDEYTSNTNSQAGNLMLPPLRYVTRGSNEYKNLDGELRRIVEKLDGVVIVVWKGRAYRIQ